MPEILNIDSTNGIIVITSTGDISKTDLCQSFENVLTAVKERDLKKVLVDVTAQDSLPSTVDLHGFASELASHMRGIKQAVLVSNRSPHNIRFVETTASNRGANIRIFTSKDDALTWLNS